MDKKTDKRTDRQNYTNFRKESSYDGDLSPVKFEKTTSKRKKTTSKRKNWTQCFRVKSGNRNVDEQINGQKHRQTNGQIAMMVIYLLSSLNLTGHSVFEL